MNAISLDAAKITAELHSNVCVILRRAALALQGAQTGDVRDLGLLPGTWIGFDCGTLNDEQTKRVRESVETWIFAASFHTLCIVIELAMTSAQDYCGLAVLGKNGQVPTAVILSHQKENDTFKNKPYDQKLAFLKQHYGITTNFEPEIASFRTIRNCLEHRHGVVTDRDKPVDGKITLRWRSLDFYAVCEDGKELRIDPLVPTEVGGAGLTTTVERRPAFRTKEFPLGTNVVLSRAEFAEVCLTAYFFGAELAKSVKDFVDATLPKPKGV